MTNHPGSDPLEADGAANPLPQKQSLPQAPPVLEEFSHGQYPEQAIPAGMYFDQQSGLLLPNGTTLATPVRRIGAWFLAIPLWIVTLGIGYIVWGLILWDRGQTPALKLLGMRVWRPDDRRPATFWWMALREVVGRIADSILSVVSALTSLILMLVGRERRTIHDYVAGTVVLHDPDNVLQENQP
jgi:uncharacterized RDD family membrane protein YckC